MAPPILPGIPAANSKPVNDRLAASFDTFIKEAPPTVSKILGGSFNFSAKAVLDYKAAFLLIALTFFGVGG